MNIVVLAGGLSPERDVSLSSGCMIANALIENGHRAALVDLYQNLPRQEYYGDYFYDKASGRQFSYSIPDTPPDLARIKQQSCNGDALIGEHIIDICRYADIVFLALHGGCGENGQLQALLDMYGIPYTGSSYTGCALAMNKELTKELLLARKISTPAYSVCCGSNYDTFRQNVLEIGFPCVIKPLSCGSSVGITILTDQEALHSAFELALSYEDSILIERYIKGREFSVGILGQTALPPIEILPSVGFYSYENKYQAGLTQEICPARLPEETTMLLKELALRVHRCLHLKAYSRIDFLLDDTGKPWCLEANTLPGMTPASLLPQEASAAGISYQKLVQKILELSLNEKNIC